MKRQSSNNEILKGRANDVDGLIFKGELQRLKNDPSGAVESLQTALHNEPDNAVGHYQLGLAYAQQRDLSRAESEWREAVRIRPDLADAQRALADSANQPRRIRQCFADRTADDRCATAVG